MMKSSLFITALGIAIIAGCSSGSEQSVESAETEMLFQDNGELDLNTGFHATVVADSTHKNARHIVINDNGDIYVKFRSSKVNGVMALRDSDNDGSADDKQEFSTLVGTGIDIYEGYLYASTKSEVFRYKLKEGSLLPDTTSAEVIVTGLPEQTSHAAKSFTFDDNGNIYVNVGAPSNACMEQARTAGSKGQDPCPQREWQAGIWKFKADLAGQTQKEDGSKYCTGTRNCVALDWNHQANSLFALSHGRDQLSSLWPDYYDDKISAELPAEEFFQINDGDDFGWPFCYYDGLNKQKVLAPEYGGNGEEIGRCTDKKDPIMAFPAHYAPNDLIFYQGDQFPVKYKNGAFIAFHGSWNRAPEPQKGYLVAFVPFKDGKPSGDWEVFAEGFTGVDTVAGPGDAAYRPMGLAEGPDGSLYITDSVKGKIWRITYQESNT